MVVESGYQHQNLIDPGGSLYYLPSLELRLGLPFDNEAVFFPPNYVHQSFPHYVGAGAAVIGMKHRIGYNKDWIVSAEWFLIPPSGSAAFGSEGLGASFNGIINYSLNAQFDFTFMLGGGSTTLSSLNGGQRYTSINPDLLLTYILNEKVNFFAEVFGQTRTGPGMGSGYNADAGVLCLVKSNVVIDLEVGQRLSGELGGYERYVGAGITIEL